jgi:hypothetical protein
MRAAGFFLLAGLTGCATTREAFYQAPDFAAKAPDRVAVLPFDNETTSLQAAGILRRLVAERLPTQGYSCVPLEAADETLQGMGVTDGGQLGAYAPKSLGEALQAKGLLYGSVEEFAYQNVGFIQRRIVRLRLRLLDAETGERLWEDVGEEEEGQIVLDRKDAARAFVRGVLDQAVGTALRSPLMRESQAAVEKVFQRLPRRY